ncbi:hypothetical protein GF376_01450 [Candidatus Peregrinibacteria bacterium]|nr:hypothetical protein [Candidatus Peregrinibacteria bacterium]
MFKEIAITKNGEEMLQDEKYCSSLVVSPQYQTHLEFYDTLEKNPCALSNNTRELVHHINYEVIDKLKGFKILNFEKRNDFTENYSDLDSLVRVLVEKSMDVIATPSRVLTFPDAEIKLYPLTANMIEEIRANMANCINPKPELPCYDNAKESGFPRESQYNLGNFFNKVG